MDHPTTRVLAVLELLQTHGRMSGAELAERLEVDRRTLRRYISILEQLGIPLTTERGRHGAYLLVAGFKLPPMMFTDDEALALAVGLLAARDLGLAAAYCDRVVVMQKGSVVETALSKSIFAAPSHAYTRKLMRATPRPGVSLRDLLPEEGLNGSEPLPAKSAPKLNGAANPAGANRAPLLVVENLLKEYPRQGVGGSLFGKLLGRKQAEADTKPFRAVDGISFTVHRGESVGLVGESGCGKSTTSTMVMRLIDKTDGVISFDGQDIGAIPAKKFARLPLRKRIQMVFQDPTDSLNPRFTAARAIADPILRLGDVRGRRAVRARCEELARQVGLPVELLNFDVE